MKDFEQRVSGARVFSGPSFIKMGPDSAQEAWVLDYLRERGQPAARVLAWGPGFMVLEHYDQVMGAEHHAVAHLAALNSLHSASIAYGHLGRLCTPQEYYAHARGDGHHPNVDPWLYTELDRLQPAFYARMRYLDANGGHAFVHGDATISNSLGTRDGIRFIDLSIRTCTSDPLQDWSKAFFSIGLGFDHPTPQPDLFKSFLTNPNVVDAFRFHLAANMIRVQRRQPLNQDLLNRARNCFQLQV